MISAAVEAMRKSREEITVEHKCPHLRVFPIYAKYLSFQCLDCRTEVSVRDQISLQLLSKVFIEAARMLALGVVIGPEKTISNKHR
jgi:hypothetical protein